MHGDEQNGQLSDQSPTPSRGDKCLSALVPSFHLHEMTSPDHSLPFSPFLVYLCLNYSSWTSSSIYSITKHAAFSRDFLREVHHLCDGTNPWTKKKNEIMR